MFLWHYHQLWNFTKKLQYDFIINTDVGKHLTLPLTFLVKTEENQCVEKSRFLLSVIIIESSTKKTTNIIILFAAND